MAPRIASSRQLGATCALGLLALAGSGRAAEPSAAERAEQLFEEGRALIKEQRFDEACDKLAESQRLDAGGGTLLNLGICRKLQGKTATAASLLREALTQAQADHRADRAATAERNLSELLPQLSHLTVRVSPSPPPADLVVELDGASLPATAFGNPLELDPGSHRLTAAEPGHTRFDLGLELRSAESRVVDVPALGPEQAAAPPPPPAPAPEPAPSRPSPAPVPAPSGPSAPRWLGYALLGSGAAAIAAGSYFGVRALSLRADSDRHFDGTRCTTQSCVTDWNSARTFAHLSDLGIGIGAVAVGAGLVVLLLPNSSKSVGPALALHVNANPAGPDANLVGEF